MAYELRKLDKGNSKTSVADAEVHPQLNDDRDAALLAHMGKKQVLKVC